MHGVCIIIRMCCAGINPLDNLKVLALRTELVMRGMVTGKKRKPELERDFDELWRGIVNVPALLQGIPEKPFALMVRHVF